MKLKVDTAGVSFLCTRAAEQRTDFGSGQPKVDKATGLGLWVVQVMALDSEGATVLSVTVPGEPKVTVGQPVTVSGSVALPWSQDGRSGVAYRADAITTSGPAKSPGTPERG